MSIRQIELRLLEYFLAVVEAGSIKAASNELNISQPALSRLINRLECNLGVPLFDRGPRGVTVTRYGEILLRNARVMADQERAMRWELNALKGLEQGVALAGVSPYLGDYLMPRVIAELVRRRPAIALRIHTGSYPDLLRALLAGESDVFFSPLPADQSRDDVRFVTVRPSLQAVVVRAGHPLLGDAAATLAQAGTYPWLLPSYPSHHEHEVVSAFLDAGLKPPRFPVQTNNVFLARELIAASDYVSIMPQAMLAAPAIKGRIVALECGFRPASTDIGYVTRARCSLPPSVRELIAITAKALR